MNVYAKQKQIAGTQSKQVVSSGEWEVGRGTLGTGD